MTSTFQYKGHYVRINPGDTIELIIDDKDLTDWLLNQEGYRPGNECEFWPQEFQRWISTEENSPNMPEHRKLFDEAISQRDR